MERHLVYEVSQKINGLVTPTWEKLVEEYLESCRIRGLTNASIYNADRCLKAATFKQWRARLCNTITTVEIRELVVDEMSRYSQTHQKEILKYIRGAFEHGVEAGHLTRNPTPQLKFRIGNKMKKVLTEEQVRILSNKAREYDLE